MRKARKKPVEIQYYTFEDLNVLYSHIIYGTKISEEDWKVMKQLASRDDVYKITTLEGVMDMTPSDYLIVGIDGEIYPCKIDIFERTYDKI